jgi:hypothetical protein
VIDIDPELGIEEFRKRPVAEVEYMALMHRDGIVENGHVAGT